MTFEEEVTNIYCVSSTRNKVVILRPPRQPLSPEDALVFAAWLVALAEPLASTKFEDVLERVLST